MATLQEIVISCGLEIFKKYGNDSVSFQTFNNSYDKEITTLMSNEHFALDHIEGYYLPLQIQNGYEDPSTAIIDTDGDEPYISSFFYNGLSEVFEEVPDFEDLRKDVFSIRFESELSSLLDDNYSSEEYTKESLEEIAKDCNNFAIYFCNEILK